MAVLKVTDSNFSSMVLASREPVLVDCWAEWCAPCRMIGPTVERISNSFKGKAKVAKLNVDENPNISRSYKINSIPTLFIFKNGKIVETIVGVQPEKVIKNKLSKYTR